MRTCARCQGPNLNTDHFLCDSCRGVAEAAVTGEVALENAEEAEDAEKAQKRRARTRRPTASPT
jgi:hypothetical protein